MSSTLKILNKDFPFIPTDKGANFLICKEYNEVFLGVYEIECHGNKLIAESVDNEIKLDVEFDGKIYETYFQLKKGDEDAVIFSLKNLGDGRRIYKEEVEVVKSIVKEEALPDPEPLIESYEVVEEAKIDIEKYKTDAIKVINENFSNKKLKIEQLQESLTSLIDERLSELSSITANEVSNLKEDIIKSVDESISKSVIDRDKTLVEINSIKDDVSSTAEFWSNILISNAREKTEQLQSLKESVAFEIDTKIAELKSELKSQESHITEAYDSIQSFINKTKRELLEEKTSSYANLEQLQKQANLVVSENLKKADLLVGKKITQLQSTADKKINDLTSLVENRVSSFDGKVNEINSALERAGIALTESINEAVKNIEYKSQESAFKLDVEVQSKINELDKTKQELTTIAESQVVKLESKIKDVEDATNKAERSLTTTVNEAVNKMQLETSAQTAEIDKAKNQLTSVAEKSLSDIKQVAANLTETVEKKVRDVTLVAVKKEDLAQLKKQLEARLDNESASLKKYVAGYGGGGSVAQQFAVGGTMNGTLNVASGQILSAGQDLFSLLGGGGGGTGVSYLSALYDVNVPAPLNGQVLTYSSSINKWTAGSGISASGQVGYYGSFYDDTMVQSDGGVDAFNVILQHTFESNGVALSGNHLVFNYPGTYEVTYSIQFANSGNIEEDVSIWFRKNGDDISTSNSIFTVPRKNNANVPGKLIAVTPFITTVNAGDKIGIYWHVPNNSTSHIVTLSAQTNPAIPITPGVIVTAKQVTLLQNITAIDTGLRSLSSNWQNTYTDFSIQSANNASVYSTVQSNSSNWQNTYTNFRTQSANNASVYSTVNANSALWTASFVSVNADNYVITSADRGKTLTDVYSTNTTICVPNNTSYPFAIGDEVTIVQDNKSASNYTVISAGDGVTIYSYNSSLSLAGNYAGATLIKKGTNDWYLFGNLK